MSWRRRLLVVVIGWLLSGGAAAAQSSVTALWDPPVDGITARYTVYYGLTPGAETGRIDVGLVTRADVPGLLAGRTYYFHVRAVSATGEQSASSTEVTFATAADPCAFPLGATSVSIFVTGKLNKTGSGGPGSKAFITFQAASPNSPVTFLSIRANGTDIPDSVTEGTNLRAPGSLWFTLPQMSATYSVFARNTAGCTRDQPTGFSTTIP